jgi:Domain of unknown function (DUF4345)
LTPSLERRLLQAAIAVGCLSPFYFGLRGVLEGPAMLVGVEPGQASPDLLSHYRYLSGLFLGLGVALLSCVPRIELRTARFRWACAAIVIGGLARALGLAMGDGPTVAHKVALGAELGLVPLLLLWQARVARLLSPAGRASPLAMPAEVD